MCPPIASFSSTTNHFPIGGAKSTASFRLSAPQAAEQLGLSPSRLYALASAYNIARARKTSPLWTPGTSGGDHAPAWPPPVLALLKKRLAGSPPCPYSFVASEALRLHACKLDRAQVRRWALANPLAHAVPAQKVPAHGRPLRLHVDYHSLCFTHDPDALTQLGWALKFYDISRRHAPTPQAKGKVEREHQFWPGRLPPCFASEQITELAVANRHLEDLRAHHNAREIHRELRRTPQRARNQARKENRSLLRPAPRCAWWPYVWSVRTLVRIATDGRVPIGTQRLRLERPPGSKVVLCLHPSGHHSVLAAAPEPQQKPALLFTNRPA